MNWTALNYEIGRELPVGRSMVRLGNAHNFIHYLPLELRQKRASKHSKRRTVYEIPLIPGVVFIRGENTWMDAVRAQYTEDSPLSNAAGEPWRIPERQILTFQSAVAEWNDLIRKRSQANQDAPKIKRKWKKFSIDVLSDLKDEMLGAEKAEQPLQARVA